MQTELCYALQYPTATIFKDLQACGKECTRRNEIFKLHKQLKDGQWWQFRIYQLDGALEEVRRHLGRVLSTYDKDKMPLDSSNGRYSAWIKWTTHIFCMCPQRNNPLYPLNRRPDCCSKIHF